MSWRETIAKALTGIKAYHSSPHDFDKFDLSKVGIGQGAQSYGHGIYAAESPKVSGQGGTYWDEFLRHRAITADERGAAEALKAAGFDREAAITRAQKDVEELRSYVPGANDANSADLYTMLRPAYNDHLLKQRERELSLLTSDNPVGPRTYELNIKAQPDQFLDWDKPLGEQSQYVRDAFTPQRLGLKEAGPLGDRGWYGWTDAKDRLIGRAQTKDVPSEIFDPREIAQTVYRGGGTWKPNEASAILSEAGIPGIKYLDAASRGPSPHTLLRAPNGRITVNSTEYPTMDAAREAKAALDAGYDASRTSNYVVFNPERDIDITKKYGVIGAPTATMGGLAAQDQYEAPP